MAALSGYRGSNCMLEKRTINVAVGKAARNMLSKWIEQSGLRNPIAGLIWGRCEELDEVNSYSFGLYERGELPVDDPIRIIEADGIELVVVQGWVCDELEGKTLDVVNGKVVLY